MSKFSILFRSDFTINEKTPEYFDDLNLDKVVDHIVSFRPRYNLKPYFFTTLDDLEDIKYRNEVLTDLENEAIYEVINDFCAKLEKVDEFLLKSQKSYYKDEKQFYFLYAANEYCDAIFYAQKKFLNIDFDSSGLKGFAQYLTDYVKSQSFINFSYTALTLLNELSSIKFDLLLKDSTITVGINNQEDFESQIFETFLYLIKESKRQYTDYKVTFDMNHVESQILEKLEKLYPDVFLRLDDFCNQTQGFIDEIINTFKEQIQFYFAFLDYISYFKKSGLFFSYPKINSNKIIIENVFNVALADEILKKGIEIITNNFEMLEDEKVAIITGPNQGGKTTFLKSITHVIYFSKLGLKVPATKAQLPLFDNIFTHFEKEEKVENLRGKLEDDLIRMKVILDRATNRSLIVLNETFSSTTFDDALFLNKQILDIILKKGSICFLVTFIDELCQIEKTVSYVASINENQERTFKIVKKAPDGLAYAMSIVAKHRLTKKDINERIQ